MARAKGPRRRKAELWALRAAVALLRALPPGAAHAGGRALARLVGRCNRRYRLPAERNVARALGCDVARARQIVRRSYESIGLNFVGLAAGVRRLDLDAVAIEGREHLRRAAALHAGGRGVLAASAHFGAWEILPALLTRHLARPHLVFRTPRNPLVVDEFHRHHGQDLAGIVPKYAGGALARLMRRGECVLALLDQNAGRRGLVVDFLGRPARQHGTAGRLAQRFGAVVLPVVVFRDPGPAGGRLRAVFDAPLEPDPARAPDDAVLDVTRRLSASLEAHVRAAPGQWNWIHDRWHNADRGGRAPPGDP